MTDTLHPTTAHLDRAPTGAAPPSLSLSRLPFRVGPRSFSSLPRGTHSLSPQQNTGSSPEKTSAVSVFTLPSSM